MFYKYLFRLLLQSVFVIALLFSFFPRTISAEELSLQLYPPITHVKAQKGQDIVVPLTIINTTNNDTPILLSLKPFTVPEDNNGRIEYVKDHNITNDYKNLFEAISIYDNDQEINTLILAPHQQKKLVLKSRIPQTLTSSNYYFSILLISNIITGHEAKESVARSYIQAGVASHILLSLKSNGSSKATLSSINTQFLHENTTIPLSIKIDNNTSEIAKIKAEIYITNMLGQTAARVTFPLSYVLAGSSRVITNGKSATTKILSPYIPGLYKAVAVLTQDGISEKQTISTYFFILPYKIIVMFILIFLIVLFTVNRAKKLSRK